MKPDSPVFTASNRSFRFLSDSYGNKLHSAGGGHGVDGVSCDVERRRRSGGAARCGVTNGRVRPSPARAASPPACGDSVLLGYCSPPQQRLHVGVHQPGRLRAARILPYSLSPPASESAPLVPTCGTQREERQWEEVSGGGEEGTEE
jgi:hypothetical protein